MEITQSTPPPASTEAGCLHSKWKRFTFFLSKRVFLRRIESILDAAAGHEGNVLPAGNYQYQVLADCASSLSKEFAERWGLDLDLLRARLPGLAKLASLSVRPPTKNCARLACLCMIGVPLALLLLGAMAGLFSVGFHLVGGR